MAVRDIITIDESKCDGCGLCANGCAEGAIRIIDGKARLIGESLCDGLGACVGHCPRDAITVEKREAGDYDEAKVMEGIAAIGKEAIIHHLAHLSSHGQEKYVREGIEWLEAHGLAIPSFREAKNPNTDTSSPVEAHSGCPGSREQTLRPINRPAGNTRQGEEAPSELTHWPIQLHLINPGAQHFEGKDVLIAADCTAFAMGSFHGRVLAGKSLVIACPKLDQGKDIYLEKLGTLLRGSRSVTVAIMEVPCCSGLLKLTLDAREKTGLEKPISVITIGIDGSMKGFRTY